MHGPEDVPKAGDFSGWAAEDNKKAITSLLSRVIAVEKAIRELRDDIRDLKTGRGPR